VVVLLALIGLLCYFMIYRNLKRDNK